MLDFPVAPSEGQLYQGPNSVAYQWQSPPGAWISTELQSPSLSDISASSLELDPSTSTNRSLKQAINTEQWVSGTAETPNLNHFKIWADDSIAGTGSFPANFFQGWTFEHYFGGGAGGKQSLTAAMYQTAPALPNNNNSNYVAIAGIGTALANDGGTDLTLSGVRGAIFGGGFVGVLRTAATNYINVTGCEFNVVAETGSSVHTKTIIQLSGRLDDRVKGSTVDAMILCGGQSVSAPKWNDGILFGSPAFPLEAFPFNASSTVLRVEPGTIGNGIDFAACTVTTSAFKSPGFTVSGTGAVTGTTGLFTGGFFQIENASGVADLELGGSAGALIDLKGPISDDFDLRILTDGVTSQINSTGGLVLIATAIALNCPLTGTTVGFTGGMTAFNATAVAAGANTQFFIKASSTADFGIFYGNNAPTFTAAKGSLYINTGAASTTTRLYVNTTGSNVWANFAASA